MSALFVARGSLLVLTLLLCPACAGVVERLRADLPRGLHSVPVGAGVTASLNPRGTGLMLRISVPLDAAARPQSRARDDYREEGAKSQQHKVLAARHVAL